MPDIPSPDALRDHAERRARAGVHADLSEVVRAGPRKSMDEDGATALHRPRRDLAAAAAEPTEDVDLRALLPSPGPEAG